MPWSAESGSSIYDQLPAPRGDRIQVAAKALSPRAGRCRREAERLWRRSLQTARRGWARQPLDLNRATSKVQCGGSRHRSGTPQV